MRSKVRVVLTVGLFAVAPLLVDRILSARQRQQDARDDELVKAYECYPIDSCVVDFNRDGTSARFEFKTTYAHGGELLIIEAAKEALRLPYDHTDNTLRTHIALHTENDKSRLLVYDGASTVPTRNSAYEWNGDKLVEVTPSGIELQILTAMAAHDDTGGWNERTLFRPFKRALYVVAYYLVFIVATAIVLFRRYRRSPT